MLPCGIQSDVGLAIESVRLGGGRRRRRSRRHRNLARFRPMTQHHQHLPFGTELDDHVRAFVHGPDVVLLIDAHRVRERETVEPFADLLDEFAGLVEFEQARVVAAGVDENVALGIGGDADRFAEIQAGRQLQKIRHGFVRHLRHVLSFGFGALLGAGQGLGEKSLRGQRCHGRQANPLASIHCGASRIRHGRD